MNTEKQMPAGSENGLPCESAPVFEENEWIKAKPIEADGKDKCFAWLYLLVGYGFVYTFTSMDFGSHLAFYTAAYAAAVLAYIFLKGGRPGRRAGSGWSLCWALECHMPFGAHAVSAGPNADRMCGLLDTAYYRQSSGKG